MPDSKDKHWHGFPTFYDALKAMAWIAGILAAIGTGVIAYAVDNLDDRYAPISLVAAVEDNGEEIVANGVTARAVDDRVTLMQKSQLRTELRGVKQASCTATPESKRWLTGELARLVVEYKDLSDDQQPFIPTCEDF